MSRVHAAVGSDGLVPWTPLAETRLVARTHSAGIPGGDREGWGGGGYEGEGGMRGWGGDERGGCVVRGEGGIKGVWHSVGVPGGDGRERGGVV